MMTASVSETKDVERSWTNGEQALLLSVYSRLTSNESEPWTIVANEMNRLCTKLTSCSIEADSKRSLPSFSALSCEAEYRQVQSNYACHNEALEKLSQLRAQALQSHLTNLKERLQKISALKKAQNYDNSDPFVQETLRRFSESNAPPVKIEEVPPPTRSETKVTRGRKRQRAGSTHGEAAAAPPSKKEVPEIVSPPRSARSSKKSVGSPSPAVPGRTRSSANIGSTPTTPVAAAPEEESAKTEVEKQNSGGRGRSNSRVSQLPPLVIRIPHQQSSSVADAVSPKPVATPAAASPSVAKSPMTRQQQKAATSLECPISPTTSSRPHTPIGSSPSVTTAPPSVTASRRSPRVAGGTAVATPKTHEVPESPQTVPTRAHRSRSKSDATNAETPQAAPHPAEPSTPASVKVEKTTAKAEKEKADKDEQAAHDERLTRTTRRLLLQIWRQVTSHRHSAIFLNPVTEDIAPNYSQIVFKPKDLSTIKHHIEAGKVTTVQGLQLELMIMFQNAMMYNGREHTVHHMAADMYDDVMQYFEAYTTTGSERREAAAVAQQQAAATLGSSKKSSARSRRRHSEVDMKPIPARLHAESTPISEGKSDSNAAADVGNGPVSTSEDANMDADNVTK